MASKYVQKYPSTSAFIAGAPDRSIAQGLAAVLGQIYVNVAGSAIALIDGSTAQTLLNKILDPTTKVSAGASATTMFSDGVLRTFMNASGVGNGADATDDVLDTFNIPASAFNANGSGVQRVVGTAWGTTAANANAKTLKLKMGASSVTLNPTTTAPNGKRWFLDYEIIRSGSSTQIIVATLSFAGVAAEAVAYVLNGAETDTAAIAVSVTGASGASAANDVLLYSHQAVFNN